MANAFAFDDDDEKPKKKARRPADDDDEEDEPPPPPKKKSAVVKPVSRPKPPVDDEDEEEEERPKPKKKPAKPVDEDEEEEEEDEDEDDDDRPKKKGKGKSKKKSKMPLIIGIAAGVLILGCGGLVTILDYTVFHVVLGSSGPKGTFESFQKAVKNEKWGDVYDMLDKASQDDMMKDTKNMKLNGKTGKDAFLEVMKDPMMGAFVGVMFKMMTMGKIESVEENGDKATIKFRPDASAISGALGGNAKMTGADVASIPMVKEGGKWKLSMKNAK